MYLQPLSQRSSTLHQIGFQGTLFLVILCESLYIPFHENKVVNMEEPFFFRLLLFTPSEHWGGDKERDIVHDTLLTTFTSPSPTSVSIFHSTSFIYHFFSSSIPPTPCLATFPHFYSFF